MLDSEFILALTAPLGGKEPVELQALSRLVKASGAGREAITMANDAAARLRASAQKLEVEKNKELAPRQAEIVKRAAALETAAKAFAAFLDERDKATAALYIADAQGNTALDAAVRGGILLERLNETRPLVLALDVVGADVDVYAKDGLFRSLQVGMASNTVVTWQITDGGGRVLSTGARSAGTPLTLVNLPD